MVTLFVYWFILIILLIALYEYTHNSRETIILFVVGFITSIVVYVGTLMFQAADTEYISGSVVSKDVHYDPDTETYTCGESTCTREIPRWRWDVNADTGATYSEYTSVKEWISLLTPEDRKLRSNVLTKTINRQIRIETKRHESRMRVASEMLAQCCLVKTPPQQGPRPLFLRLQ